ncbi:hypothetical protein BpHYR1_015124 [Brachionus plicatilis]|uniref:RNA-directed DNA polymerase from mobile element jockey-like n=1 Tax=Brachionus plicatilis TaxID=10195 RepID=A0A3M7SAH3_BRAPC|nr:hypothetical protein BpHYR1_015124 [Brachionus plicatilis]
MLIDSKPSEKQFWNKLKTHTESAEALPNSTLNSDEKVETFAKHFEQAFTTNCKSKPKPGLFKYYTTNKHNTPISNTELDKAISNLKNTNSKTFNISPTLSLKIDNTTILKINNPILLGITLDKHLSFDKHFQDMQKSLAKKIHLIRLLSSKNYNINPEYLITIYKAFSSKSNPLQNPIQYAPRILKVSQKTPTILVHTLANTQPLNTKIKTLLINYISIARINKIKSTNILINEFKPYTGKRNYSIIDSLYPNILSKDEKCVFAKKEILILRHIAALLNKLATKAEASNRNELIYRPPKIIYRPLPNL